MKRRGLGMVLGAMTLGSTLAFAAKVETWRQDTSAAFSKGKKERVVISETGQIRLGQSLGPVGSIKDARV